MKKTFLFLAAVFAAGFTYAQSSSTAHSFICSYYGEPVSKPITLMSSSADAKTVINEIIDVVGLEPAFEVRSANVPNAAAVVSAGKRFILYNPEFIKALNSATNDKWAAIAIIAHEVGHHLNGHTLTGAGSRPHSELEADQFSGFVLRKMGASLSQAQLSIKLIANNSGTATHPGRASRLVSIENGWNKAEAQILGKQYIARSLPDMSTPVPQARTVSSRSYVLNPKYIMFHVLFHGDKSSPYYITTSENLVTIKNEEVLVLGKLIGNDDANYPLSIRLDDMSRLYISRSGSILNASGKAIGNVQPNN